MRVRTTNSDDLSRSPDGTRTRTSTLRGWPPNRLADQAMNPVGHSSREAVRRLWPLILTATSVSTGR